MKLQNVILAAALFALAAPFPARGQVIPPPGLLPGQQYELAFVTQGTRDATSPNIADYNAFVTAQAQENPNLPQGVTWNAIASASGNINTGVGFIQASQNAPFTPSIPVYNTQGQLVADAAHPLYNEALEIINPINYDQFGNVSNSWVWTGSDSDGTPDNPLGGTSVWGPPDIAPSAAFYYGGFYVDWLGNCGMDTATNLHPLYALSSPITAVPEPSAFVALLGAGAAGLIGLAWRRWRRCPSDSRS